MRILFVCDYFPPFIIGGGEISSYWQVKKLLSKGIKVITLAPRFEDNLVLKKENFKRYWYRFPFRLKAISPIMFLNPLFVLHLSIKIISIVRKEKIDLIHCQSKYSAPAGIIAKYFLKKPLIITLRDYWGICNNVFCLYGNKKSCNLISHFNRDFLFYYRHYIKNKNIFTFCTQFAFSFFGRINTYILAFIMKKADRFISVSDYLKEVYITNGYDKNKIFTIYNFMPQVIKNKGIIPISLKKTINKYKYIVLYAGKLSLGKGANLLIEAALKIVKSRKDVLFIFAGNIYYPISKIDNKQLLFLGRVNYDLILQIISIVDLVCVPSIWPEPLSRGVIEAYTLGKTVLASTAGGPKEIINKRTGWLFQLNPNNLLRKLNNALRDKQRLKNLGENGKQYMFSLEEKQIDKLIKLYENSTV